MSMPEASTYFNANWERYQDTLRRNTLYHQEMLATLQQTLDTFAPDKPLHMVDLGCGDASMVRPIIMKRALKKYTAVDAAPDILAMARENLQNLQADTDFICADMLKAIRNLSEPADLIYTSYAVHHLSQDDKTAFLQACKAKLSPGGCLLMVDGVLPADMTRDVWLDALAARMREANPAIADTELAARMEHPRSGDFPETIAFFRQTAASQGWKRFEVLLDKGIFASMRFKAD